MSARMSKTKLFRLLSSCLHADNAFDARLIRARR